MALISVTELQQLIADTLAAKRRLPERTCGNHGGDFFAQAGKIS